MTTYQKMRAKFEREELAKKIKRNEEYVKAAKVWMFFDDLFANIALISLCTCAAGAVSGIFCFGAHKIALGQAALDGNTEPTINIDQPQRTAANYPPFMWEANQNISSGTAICAGAVFLGSLIAKSANDSAFDKAKGAIYNDVD